MGQRSSDTSMKETSRETEYERNQREWEDRASKFYGGSISKLREEVDRWENHNAINAIPVSTEGPANE